VDDQGGGGNAVMAHIAVAVLVGRADVQGNGVAAIGKGALVHVVIAAAMVFHNAQFSRHPLKGKVEEAD